MWEIYTIKKWHDSNTDTSQKVHFNNTRDKTVQSVSKYEHASSAITVKKCYVKCETCAPMNNKNKRDNIFF